MQILLIAATGAEISSLNDTGQGIDTLITGVGCPATIYHLQKRLQQINYDLVIQAGIAGSFKTANAPGQTVLVSHDRFGDIGTEEKENFRSVFESGLADENEFPYEQGWLVNKNMQPFHSSLPVVKAVTVNKVSDSLLQKEQLSRQFDPAIESMEGAALHYVCLQEQISFLQVRAISNRVGERDKTKWVMKEAIDNLYHELRSLINQLTR